METMDLNYFFLAAYHGDIFVLKKYLDNGFNVHSCEDLALRLASRGNHTKAIIFLLTRGANIQVLYDTELRRASLEGDIETIKLLLENYNCSNKAKIYAMYNAIFARHEEIIILLLKNGVSPTANDNAILKVVKYCNNEQITKLFKNYLK